MTREAAEKILTDAGYQILSVEDGYKSWRFNCSDGVWFLVTYLDTRETILKAASFKHFS